MFYLSDVSSEVTPTEPSERVTYDTKSDMTPFVIFIFCGVLPQEEKSDRKWAKTREKKRKRKGKKGYSQKPCSRTKKYFIVIIIIYLLSTYLL